MKDEIKKILDDLLFTTTLPNVSVKLSEEKLNQLKDYITNLQEENNNLKEDFKRHIDRINELTERSDNLQEKNAKKDNIINGIEEFIEYLDRETNVYLVNTAFTVILGKLKKLKIDNGLLQGSDKDE